LDIVGPLRKALGGYTHLLVAIDKFSKWVEVRLITNIRAEQAVTFFTDVIYRFGVPNSIITDNGYQFTGRNSWSSVTSSTSASIGRLWCIHRPTVKWSGPTA
jgi:transposase-like protein